MGEEGGRLGRLGRRGGEAKEGAHRETRRGRSRLPQSPESPPLPSRPPYGAILVASSLNGPSPAAPTACTRNTYVLPGVRPVTVALLLVEFFANVHVVAVSSRHSIT